MDLFPDGIHVRLRNRVHGTYLYADGDGEGISLRPRGHDPAAGGVWRVHRVVRDGIHYVLLHGAAYGRYLALSPYEEAAPTAGRIGRAAVQRDYDHLELNEVMWMPAAVPGSPGYVLLRHVLNCTLRANGRFQFWNNAAVSLDNYFNVATRSTMRHWRVEVVAPRQQPPTLPLFERKQVPVGGVFFWRTKPEVDGQRTIRFRLSNQALNDVTSCSFYGRSVFNLRAQMGIRANHGDVYNTIVCVQAGLHGRLTPLFTDLPRSEAPMNIVVFVADGPDAEGLVFPDVDA